MKGMLNILNKIKASHISRVRYKDRISQIQQLRLDVCKSCPLNSDNASKGLKMTLILLLNKTLNKIYKIKTSKDSSCLGCGCNLELKSQTNDCYKWNQIKEH